MRYINTWSRVFRLSILSLLSLALADSTLQAKLSESDPLPALSTLSLVGELPDLSGKVVLLDFWASWCAPCKASFPAMDAIYREYKDQGFVILAVSVDSTQKAYQQFASKSGVSFPLAWDADKQLVKLAEIEAMPTSYMIDKKGTVRSVHAGFNGKKTIQAYRSEIENLLAE